MYELPAPSAVDAVDAAMRHITAEQREPYYKDLDNNTLLLARDASLRVVSYSDGVLLAAVKSLDNDILPDDFLALDERERLGSLADYYEGMKQDFSKSDWTTGRKKTLEEVALENLREKVAERLFRLAYLREPYTEGRYEEVIHTEPFLQGLGFVRRLVTEAHHSIRKG